MTTFSERFFTALLLMYPAGFRRSYADEMRQVFRTRARHCASVPSWAELWAHTIMDLTLTAIAERVDSLRSVVRSPFAPLAAGGAIALTIGMFSGLFHVVRGVVFRPHETENPIVTVYREGETEGRGSITRGTLYGLRNNARVVDGVATVAFQPVSMLPKARVSSNFFQVLGVRPAYGQLDVREEKRTVTVSYDYFTRRFGADPDAVGSRLTIAGVEHIIAGVLPSDFSFIGRRIDVWMPLDRESSFVAVARLRPGVTVDAAAKEIERIGGEPVRVVYLQDDLLRHLRPSIYALLAACGLVFAVGALNVTAYGGEPGYWLFFIAKTVSGLIAAVSCVVAACRSNGDLWGSASTLMTLWIVLLLSCGVVYWSLADQSVRCRSCLRRLRMPVTRGSWASLVIDRPAINYICPFGHGELYVPGTRLLPLDAMTWTDRGDMWRELEGC